MPAVVVLAGDKAGNGHQHTEGTGHLYQSRFETLPTKRRNIYEPFCDTLNETLCEPNFATHRLPRLCLDADAITAEPIGRVWKLDKEMIYEPGRQIELCTQEVFDDRFENKLIGDVVKRV